MDSFEKFNDQQLPPKDQFYSILKEGISNEQYRHAQKVLNVFEMKTMGDYHDLYLKSDVLLLFMSKNMPAELQTRSSTLFYQSRSFMGCHVEIIWN